jgi:hypothetical protein
MLHWWDGLPRRIINCLCLDWLDPYHLQRKPLLIQVIKVGHIHGRLCSLGDIILIRPDEYSENWMAPIPTREQLIHVILSMKNPHKSVRYFTGGGAGIGTRKYLQRWLKQNPKRLPRNVDFLGPTL